MSLIANVINTDSFSASLRRRGIDLATKRVLVTRFAGSQQERDLTVPVNCGGFGRIHHFRRDQGLNWPSNPLPIDPATRFLKMGNADTLLVQVFQNAVCSWRCWYCYVDFDLLSANPKHSDFLGSSDLLDLYEREADAPNVIDLSGGQPDLVPEWTLWIADALNKRGWSDRIYLWSDDNLSNDYLWRFLDSSEISRLASYRNYGRVGCFKGFDESSFSFNTNAAPELWHRQFEFMHRLIDAGFDVYGYVTLTTQESANISQRVRRFVDLLQEKIHQNMPLRLIPLRIREYSPTEGRLNDERSRAMALQCEAVTALQNELEVRFTAEERSKSVVDIKLT